MPKKPKNMSKKKLKKKKLKKIKLNPKGLLGGFAKRQKKLKEMLEKASK